jgi:hypothetical protein
VPGRWPITSSSRSISRIVGALGFGVALDLVVLEAAVDEHVAERTDQRERERDRREQARAEGEGRIVLVEHLSFYRQTLPTCLPPPRQFE